MRSVQAAQFDQALHALELMLGFSGGYMPMWLERPGRRRRYFHAVGVPGAGRLLVDLVRTADERHSDEILLGLPESQPWHGPTRGTVLWCRVEGKDQLARARRFRPLPSLVLAEGSTTRRLLIWALRRAVPYHELEDANRKIAYALRATQKHGVPENLRIPAPGTCLRVGKSRPVPVVVSRLTTASYLAPQIVGRLKQPPEIKWWEAGA